MTPAIDEELQEIKTETTGIQFRNFEARVETINVEERTVEFSFSSEEPVRRFFWEALEEGWEILDHKKKSVRLERLNRAGNLLKFHDRKQWLGKILKAWIDSGLKMGRVRVRFHKSELAEFEDVADGTKTTVSFAYVVHKYILEKTDENEGPTYRATDWEPYEVSLEPTPADITVGVGRGTEPEAEIAIRTVVYGRSAPEFPPANNKHETREGSEMETTEKKTPAGEARQEDEARLATVRAEAKTEARNDELARIDGIQEIAGKWRDKVPSIDNFSRKAISEGLSVKQFEAMVAPILDATPTDRFLEDGTGGNDTGLSKKDLGDFRLVRLLAAMALGHESPALREAAAFELECCRATAERSSSPTPDNGVKIPPEIFRAPIVGDAFNAARVLNLPVSGVPRGARDMTAGGATTGVPLIQTDVLGGSMIDFLRDMSVLLPRSTVWRGVRGNIAIPRVTAGVTGSFVAEGSAPAESTPALDQVTLSPKTLIAFIDLTRRLLLQSSIDVEAWLRRELASYFAITMENAMITDRGADTTRPQGILGISGTIANNVGAGSFDWAHVCAYEANVQLNAALLGGVAFLTNPKVTHLMKTTAKDAGSGRYLQEGGEANGYPVLWTNQVPSNLGGGSESANIFGSLTEGIAAFWEDYAITVDPYTQANAGIIRVTEQMEADYNVRHPEAFSVAEDISTTI